MHDWIINLINSSFDENIFVNEFYADVFLPELHGHTCTSFISVPFLALSYTDRWDLLCPIAMEGSKSASAICCTASDSMRGAS